MILSMFRAFHPIKNLIFIFNGLGNTIRRRRFDHKCWVIITWHCKMYIQCLFTSDPTKEILAQKLKASLWVDLKKKTLFKLFTHSFTHSKLSFQSEANTDVLDIELKSQILKHVYIQRRKENCLLIGGCFIWQLRSKLHGNVVSTITPQWY